MSHGTIPDERWGPCKVLERAGNNLIVQDGAGERFEVTTNMIAVLPKGYQMFDGKFERIGREMTRSVVEDSTPDTIHIVRTDDWRKAGAAPITRAHVDELMLSDPELAWSIAAWTVHDAQSPRGMPILWRGDEGFWWTGNSIRCRQPSHAQLAKMIEIAVQLDANVLSHECAELH